MAGIVPGKRAAGQPAASVREQLGRDAGAEVAAGTDGARGSEELWGGSVQIVGRNRPVSAPRASVGNV